MVPIGVDVHKRRCKVLEFNEGTIKVRRPIENTRADWLELLPELPPDAEIALEVSTAGTLRSGCAVVVAGGVVTGVGGGVAAGQAAGMMRPG